MSRTGYTRLQIAPHWIVAVGNLVIAMLNQALWSDGTVMRMLQPGRA